jgi:hypothetical protein
MPPDGSPEVPGLGLDQERRTLTLSPVAAAGAAEMQAQVMGALVAEAFPASHASHAIVAAACLSIGLCGYAAAWARGLVAGHGSWMSGAVLPVGYVCVLALVEYRRYALCGDAHRRRAEVLRLASDDEAVMAAYARLCPPSPSRRKVLSTRISR